MEPVMEERTELSELRRQAEETVLRAANWLGVSAGHLSNCERGLASLTPEQEAAIRTYYLARIKDRLDRLSASIARSG